MHVCACACACACVCMYVCVCLDSILISQMYSQVPGNEFSNMVREMESHLKNTQIHRTPNAPCLHPSSYSIPTPSTPTPPSQLPPSTRSCATANSPSASSKRTTVAIWLWSKEGPPWTKPLSPLLPTPQPYRPGPQPPIIGVIGGGFIV